MKSKRKNWQHIERVSLSPYHLGKLGNRCEFEGMEHSVLVLLCIQKFLIVSRVVEVQLCVKIISEPYIKHQNIGFT